MKYLKIIPILFLFSVSSPAQETPQLIPVKVNVGDRSLSKLPFVIAQDQGMYKKYGLEVDIRLSEPEFQGGIGTEELFRVNDRQLDFNISGHSPNIMSQITYVNTAKYKAIGSTDCKARSFIIGKNDATLPFDYKGKRIGVSGQYSTTDYVAKLLATRHRLDPVHDIAILSGGQSYEDLVNDQVDVVIMAEIKAALAMQNGHKVLEDTSKWNAPIAGNSVLVSTRWLNSEANNAKASAFLQAIAEALSVIHKDESLTLSIMKKWYGINDTKLLDIIYERAKYLPKKPLICIEGINSTLAVYKSNITDRYSASDFYDDRFVNEIESSGFFDSLYK